MAAGPAPAHAPGVREEPRCSVADGGGAQHGEPLRRRVRHLAGRCHEGGYEDHIALGRRHNRGDGKSIMRIIMVAGPAPAGLLDQAVLQMRQRADSPQEPCFDQRGT
ncbi:MAG: hypothetical protein C7B47_17085 [Sulfobacillus thermosulfidooxidans]|nr:MAG: hypothetical protein C7B47_17085 [Sulfobacillus thermosulfidooxidans]